MGGVPGGGGIVRGRGRLAIIIIRDHFSDAIDGTAVQYIATNNTYGTMFGPEYFFFNDD
jgi:hypothetical protein